MSPYEYRAYSVCGYVHCFIHASSSYWDVVLRAVVSDGYVQWRKTGEKEWSAGKPAIELL